MKDFQLWQLRIFQKVTKHFTFLFISQTLYLGYGFSVTIGEVTFNEASRAPPEGIAIAAYSLYCYLMLGLYSKALKSFQLVMV